MWTLFVFLRHVKTLFCRLQTCHLWLLTSGPVLVWVSFSQRGAWIKNLYVLVYVRRGSLELGMTEQRRCDWKGGKSDINVHFWGHWGEQMLCHVPTMCKAVVLALRILGWLNYRQELRVLRKNQISNKYLYKEINNWSLQRSSMEEKVYSAVREWKRK